MSEAQKFGLIGRNISYSRSKEIFELMFRNSGLDASFDIVSVDDSQFESAVEGLTGGGYSGFSVTIPYKQRILPMLDELDQVAEVIGAANSVAVNRGRLVGYNTDSYGVARALKDHGLSLRHGNAIVVGCGGAARAVVHALKTEFEMERVLVLGRTRDRLESFKRFADTLPGPGDVVTDDIRLLETPISEKVGLVVNCTPAGGFLHPVVNLMSAFDWTRTDLYFDLNYNPDNVMIAGGSAAGCVCLDGSLMLVAQAARSLELWTGHKVGIDLIHRAVFGNNPAEM